ncbi:Uncharacterised protein [Streptococcus pneumoniae]|nr:Uncharacterised protein [Streptococcus pneumoniae]VTH68562.1 Uncharacterised protein [Streptococcus pneumoniae]
MEWTDWVDWKPETKTDIKIKIENDGYTFPHYDKKNNGVKYVISTMDIKQDCLRLGVPFEDVPFANDTFLTGERTWQVKSM